MRSGQQVRSASPTAKYGLRRAKAKKPGGVHIEGKASNGAQTNLNDPGPVIGVSTVTGQRVTLAGVSLQRGLVLRLIV